MEATSTVRSGSSLVQMIYPGTKEMNLEHEGPLTSLEWLNDWRYFSAIQEGQCHRENGREYIYFEENS